MLFMFSKKQEFIQSFYCRLMISVRVFILLESFDEITYFKAR